MKSLILWLICGYQQYISPLFPSCCRFHPTCSAYAKEAVTRFGARKGMGLILRRICRCHPFHQDKTVVVDPVPERDEA